MIKNRLRTYQGRIFAKSRFLGQSWLLLPVIGLLLGTFIILGFTNSDSSIRYHSLAAKKWVGTWSTAPQLVEPHNMPPAPGLDNSTLRQIVCVSIGGEILRVKFSTRFSKSQVEMESVQIAVSTEGSSIEDSTTEELKFNGMAKVVMEPGSNLISDPVRFKLEPRMKIAITISFGKTSPDLTGHPGSRTTSYLLAGKHSSQNTDFAQSIEIDHWYVINGIDIEMKKSAAAVAILGNSITDGRGSGTNKQNRWPDVLAMRLLNNKNTGQIGVLNMGIGGNCVLKGGLGPTALNRFDQDVLNQNGVRWLIIMEGVNDIGATKDSTEAFNVANDLIFAYQKMIDKAHSKGIKVFGGTITPIKKSFYYTDYRELAREMVNKWIRTSGKFDAVIDFDKAIRDPVDKFTILPEAQSGDYLHPNELGYIMMGDAIQLSLFN